MLNCMTIHSECKNIIFNKFAIILISCSEHVITVNATDADSNKEIDYRIISGAQDQFRIIVNTGEIVVNDRLDREAENGQFYTILVQALDRGLVSLDGLCNVTINITDVNDVAPIFGPVQPINIPESK